MYKLKILSTGFLHGMLQGQSIHWGMGSVIDTLGHMNKLQNYLITLPFIGFTKKVFII